LGTAELGLGHFDAAIVEFQKAIDAGDRSFIPYTNLAAAYSLEGKTGEAKSALAERPTPQSQTHHQVADGPRTEYSAPVRRSAQSGTA